MERNEGPPPALPEQLLRIVMSLGAGPFQQPGIGLALAPVICHPHSHPPNLTLLTTEQVTSTVLRTQATGASEICIPTPLQPTPDHLLTIGTPFPSLLLGCQSDTYLTLIVSQALYQALYQELTC